MAELTKPMRKATGRKVKRSLREQGLRAALLVLIAGLGYHSVTFSLAQVLVKANPALAHRLAPDNGRITAAYSVTLAGPDATVKDRVQADELAQLALRQDPTAVAAVATLGINAQARGYTNRARRLFAYSQKLSRRDVRTQLWSIEDAVARQDIPGALRWYDAALRTNRKLDALLFPILVSASEDPAIQGELVRKLAANPLWGEGFIKFAAGNGPDPRATAKLFEELRGAKVSLPESAKVGVIDALVRKRYFAEAWAFYATIRPQVTRLRSRDPKFSTQLEQPTQFDWIPVNDADVSTSIRDNSFYFTVQSNAGGTLLWQKQILTQGRYRLSGHVIELDQPGVMAPAWVLSCDDGRELGRLSLVHSGGQTTTFTTVFDVPANCPVQTLSLVALPSDRVTGVTGRIGRTELAPVE